MAWAQRLKRVFNIDIEVCTQCGGPVKVIPTALATFAGQALASIEDPDVIKKILDHLKQKGETQDAVQLPDARAPPQGRLFD